MKSFTAILALASVAAVSAAPAEKRSDNRLYYKLANPYYVTYPTTFCAGQWDVFCVNYAAKNGGLQAPSPSCTYNANLDGGVIMANCVYENHPGTYTDATAIVGSLLEAYGMLKAA